MIRIHAHPCFGQKKTQSSALQQRAVALEIEITASALQQEVAHICGRAWPMLDLYKPSGYAGHRPT
jgi:hypothetical protein